MRSEELEKQKTEQEAKAKELADTEAAVKKQCETAVAEEVARIQADERSIREKEKTEIYAEWEADKAKQKSELEKYLKSQRKKIDSELEKAHAERLEAEEKKLERIHEADLAIEEKRAELTREYEEKVADYSKKKSEYEAKLEDLREQQADLDADTELNDESYSIDISSEADSESYSMEIPEDQLEAYIMSRKADEIPDRPVESLVDKAYDTRENSAKAQELLERGVSAEEISRKTNLGIGAVTLMQAIQQREAKKET